jgi:phosphomannomutase
MDLSGFKAYDIRGNYPAQVNEDLAYLVGRAFVRYLSAKNIVVGFDMRDSSASLKEKVIEGISCEGADVIDIGLCSTPMLISAVIDYDYDGGVMISASHSPGDQNGFKLIDKNGIQIGEDFGLSDIKEIVRKGFTRCPGRGAITEKNILSDYMVRLINLAEKIEHLKVVVDYSSGVGSVAGKPLFTRLSDLEVIELNEVPDGNFPSHPANPHDIENFKELQDKVIETGADVGLFFDGDADRVQAVDEKGNVVPMDLLFCLLAEDELRTEENKKKEYYYDLRFSKIVPEIIKKLGGFPVMMRVGNPYYKKALAKSGVLAAEYSGHVMYADNHNIDDGLYCSLKILKMLTDSEKPLSVLIKNITHHQTSNEISLVAKNPETVFDRVRMAFPKGKEIELDGLYLDFNDGFISVRQSQTEPNYFRIRVEAGTKEVMEKRINDVIKIVSE